MIAFRELLHDELALWNQALLAYDEITVWVRIQLLLILIVFVLVGYINIDDVLGYPSYLALQGSYNYRTLHDNSLALL